MSNTLGREAILAAKRKTVSVECPELGGAVVLKELSISQLQKLDKDVTAQLAQMIVDETGNRLFTTAEEIIALGELSAGVTTRLIQAAARLNGVAQSAVDEAVKNLLASPNESSESV